MKIRISDLQKRIIFVLLLFMPFHVVIFNFIENGILTLWRDILILFSLSISISLSSKKNQHGKDILWIILVVRTISCIIFAFIFHDYSMSATIWVNVLRIYLLPSFVVFILRRIKINYSFLHSCCKLYLITAVVVSLFGIIQMFFIGRPYLHAIGVGQSSVLLADGTQRNIGVFESANVMAVFVLFAIIIQLKIRNIFMSPIISKIIIILLLISLALTFSISVGLVSIILFLYESVIAKKDEIKKRDIAKFCFGVVGMISVFLIIISSSPAIVLLIQEQFSSKLIDILSTLSGTNTIASSSASIHYQDLFSGFTLLINNINGLGFAKESFMVFDKVRYRLLLGLKESSLLTIMYDFGLFVGLIYLIPLVYALFSKKNKSFRNIYLCKQYLLISTFIVYLFLPLIQSYELSFYVYFFVGLLYYYQYEDQSTWTYH